MILKISLMKEIYVKHFASISYNPNNIMFNKFNVYYIKILHTEFFYLIEINIK